MVLKLYLKLFILKPRGDNMNENEEKELTVEEKKELIAEAFGVTEGDTFDDLLTAMGVDEEY